RTDHQRRDQQEEADRRDTTLRAGKEIGERIAEDRTDSGAVEAEPECAQQHGREGAVNQRRIVRVGQLGHVDARRRVRVEAENDDVDEWDDKKDREIDREGNSENCPVWALRGSVHFGNSRTSAATIAARISAPTLRSRAALPWAITARGCSPLTTRRCK